MADGHKRLLVHARQSMRSRAGRARAGAVASAAAAHGLEFMSGTSGRAAWCWFTTTDDRGAPLDRRKDLYCHAFAIFALATQYRASGEPESLRLAIATLDLLRDRLRDRGAGGFFEAASEDWQAAIDVPRRQNPHMHLVEALLALDAVPPRRRPRGSTALVELLAERWIDLRTTRSASTSIRPGARGRELGRSVEPGHHFEWFWLLDRLRPASPAGRLPPCPTGSYNLHGGSASTRTGAIRSSRSRRPACRPHQAPLAPDRAPEALAARVRATRDAEVGRELEAGLRYCFARHVDPKTGAWHEQLARDGRVVSEAVNATSVYHSSSRSRGDRGLEVALT